MATVTRPAAGALRRRTNIGNSLFYGLVLTGAASILLVVVLMIGVLVNESWDAITHFGLNFFTTQTWNPTAEKFGALAVIYGTVVSALIALIIAVPISIGVAIFLSEVAPPQIRVPASFLVEMLAAVPSVVFGLWGLFVLVPKIRDPLERFLGDWFGWLPLFQGAHLGIGMLAAGIILAIMIMPIITAISRDVLLAVPNSQREAALALGATRWEMIWGSVLPYARPGITGAVILGLGRAIGETMAVTMLIGNQFKINTSLFAPANTLPSAIASQLGESSGLHRASLIELGVVLLFVTLLVNVAARVLVWRISQHVGGDVRL